MSASPRDLAGAPAGSRSAPLYATLRAGITSGQLTAGSRLPGFKDLAAEYGLSPVTVRQVLARLETEGLLVRRHGSGTYVRAQEPPAVLAVDDDHTTRILLRRLVQAAGYRALEADGPRVGLAQLEAGNGIALVLSDVRMPAAEDGLGFIRTVRARWPRLPLAAVTGYAEDLSPLLDSADFPVMVIAKPIRPEQLATALRLALEPPPPPLFAPPRPRLADLLNVGERPRATTDSA